VLTELRQRGVQDICIASMGRSERPVGSGERGVPQEADPICIVHLVRASLRYVNAKDSKAEVAALKRIYQSATADEALAELNAFEADWGGKYRAWCGCGAATRTTNWKSTHHWKPALQNSPEMFGEEACRWVRCEKVGYTVRLTDPTANPNERAAICIAARSRRNDAMIRTGSRH
jgi:hypothetical protein